MLVSRSIFLFLDSTTLSPFIKAHSNFLNRRFEKQIGGNAVFVMTISWVSPPFDILVAKVGKTI